MLTFDILTIFPTFFESPFKESIIKRGIENNLISIRIHNIRDYAEGKHKVTDDYPYGGGSGMVMKPEPVIYALEAVQKLINGKYKRIFLSPQGIKFNQKIAQELSEEENIILLCGNYEGIDQRVIDNYIDLEISIGDFILTGGEYGALIIVNAVARLVPGVLGNKESLKDESFSEGLLEYPQYTRPQEFMGLKVPQVLISGNHANINRWRREESLKRTLERRPDLLKNANLTKEDLTFLTNLKKEQKSGGIE